MIQTTCGFCKGTTFEVVPHKPSGLYVVVYQCAKCGHPAGIAYDPPYLKEQLENIAKDVQSLKKTSKA